MVDLLRVGMAAMLAAAYDTQITGRHACFTNPESLNPFISLSWNPAKPESTETNLHLGRGCERSVRWLLRAFSYAPTGARLRVLVAAFGSSRPASQSASSARWIRVKYRCRPLGRTRARRSTTIRG